MEDDLILGGTDMEVSEDPRDMIIYTQIKIIDCMYYVEEENVSIERKHVLSNALKIIIEVQKQILQEVKPVKA
jgi:hypothetical protein